MQTSMGKHFADNFVTEGVVNKFESITSAVWRFNNQLVRLGILPKALKRRT